MALRPEGLRLPVRPPAGAAADRSAGRVVGLRRGVPRAAPLAGHMRPLAVPRGEGRDRVPGRPDWPAVRRRCHDLLAEADFGLPPLTDDFLQMRGFRIEHPDPPALERSLYELHRIEVPIFETRHGWTLRVSVEAYNDE